MDVFLYILRKMDPYCFIQQPPLEGGRLNMEVEREGIPYPLFYHAFCLDFVLFKFKDIDG